MCNYIANTDEYNINNTKTRAKSTKSLRGNALSVQVEMKCRKKNAMFDSRVEHIFMIRGWTHVKHQVNRTRTRG